MAGEAMVEDEAVVSAASKVLQMVNRAIGSK